MTIPATVQYVSCQLLAEEELLLVTPEGGNEPDGRQLLAPGFIGHPGGAHHACMLVRANYPQFRHSRQFERTGFSNQITLILEPVSLGSGFTVLPRHAVEASGQDPHRHRRGALLSRRVSISFQYSLQRLPASRYDRYSRAGSRAL